MTILMSNIYSSSFTDSFYVWILFINKKGNPIHFQAKQLCIFNFASLSSEVQLLKESLCSYARKFFSFKTDLFCKE